VNGTAVPDRVFDTTVDLLEELCAISSASGDALGLVAMANRLARHLEGLGLTAEVWDEPGPNGAGQPVLLARSLGDAQGTVLLLGHLDTVLPAVAPRRQGDRLVATGALDMKGGLAAFAGALELLAAADGAIPPGLELLCVPDEEVGGPISEHMVHRRGADARAVLVLEPGELRDHSETLVTGRRGLTVWRLDARGRAAHSGLAYWEGRSALAAAATWAGAVQRISEKGAGPIVNVGRIVGGDSEFVQDLGEEHHFIGTSQRLNVVPDRCIVEGEVRYLAGADRDRALAVMGDLASQLAEGWGVEMDLEVVQQIPPVNPKGPGGEVARRLVEVAAAGGWTLELERDRGGVSFPNFLPDPSAVTIVDGLGPCGGGMHTREEYVELGSLRRRIALIAQAIRLAASS
jgi:glutamate carboxypeptidase